MTLHIEQKPKQPNKKHQYISIELQWYLECNMGSKITFDWFSHNIKITLAIAAWASFVTFVFGGSASLTMRHTTADGKFRSSGRSAISYNELKLLKSERCSINININTLAEESGKKTTTYITAELRAKFKLLYVMLEMGLINNFWKTFAKLHWVSWKLCVNM